MEWQLVEIGNRGKQKATWRLLCMIFMITSFRSRLNLLIKIGSDSLFWWKLDSTQVAFLNKYALKNSSFAKIASKKSSNHTHPTSADLINLHFIWYCMDGRKVSRAILRVIHAKKMMKSSVDYSSSMSCDVADILGSNTPLLFGQFFSLLQVGLLQHGSGIDFASTIRT